MFSKMMTSGFAGMNPFSLYVLLGMGLIFLLACNISRLRITLKQGLGDGGKKPIKAAIRAHMNAIEHGVPFGFIVFVVYAQAQISESAQYSLVWAYLAARIAHVSALFFNLPNVRRISATLFYGTELLGLIWIGMGLFV